jgi:hypothetical protein
VALFWRIGDKPNDRSNRQNGIGAAPMALRASGEPKEQAVSEDQILPLFDPLPGDKSVEISLGRWEANPNFCSSSTRCNCCLSGACSKNLCIG